MLTFFHFNKSNSSAVFQRNPICKNVLRKAYNKEKKEKYDKEEISILKDRIVPFIKKRSNDSLSEVSTSKIEALHSLHAQFHPKHIPTRNQIEGKMGLTALVHNVGYEETLLKQTKVFGVNLPQRVVSKMTSKDNNRRRKREHVKANYQDIGKEERKRKKIRQKIEEKNKVVHPPTYKNNFEDEGDIEDMKVAEMRVYLEQNGMKKSGKRQQLEEKLKYILNNGFETTKLNHKDWFKL